MNTPSAEALALAVRLSGHTHCQTALHSQGPDSSFRNRHVCEGCLGDAQTIDATLQLPARNAALLLAQSVCDEPPSSKGCPHWEIIDQLRDALAAIPKTK